MILGLFVCRLFCFSLLAVVDRPAARVFLILSTTGHLSLFPLLFRPQGEVSSDYWIPNLFICFTSVQSTQWSWVTSKLQTGRLGQLVIELAFHQCCPGSISTLWIEFFGSLLCPKRFFPGYSGFPNSSKTNVWLDLICWTIICKIVIWAMLISCRIT